MFKNNDVIKNKWSTKNIFLPKSSEIDSRRTHKISKSFDEKQKNCRSKDWSLLLDPSSPRVK